VIPIHGVAVTLGFVEDIRSNIMDF